MNSKTESDHEDDHEADEKTEAVDCGLGLSGNPVEAVLMLAMTTQDHNRFGLPELL